MPYCTIEEAWGVSLSDNSPINPKIGTNNINNNDKTSRNYKKLENHNGNDRYSRNKNALEINLEEYPTVNHTAKKEKEEYTICNKQSNDNVVNSESTMCGPIIHNEKIKKSIYSDDLIEGFDIQKINKIMEENRYLKELVNKNNNPNSELILFVVMGIFLLYIFELFVRIGKK